MTGGVRVEITRALKDKLKRQGIDPGVFVYAFRDWKTGWPKQEYESPLFGKDGSYIFPKVDGVPYTLEHVHLVPLTDEAGMSSWKKAFHWRRRKLSDRVLVYVGKHPGPYLLIFILDEPDAHEIAKMRTADDSETMQGFAEVAAAFLWNGSIIR